MKLAEGLRQNDLKNLIRPYFSVDIFEPKFGKNEEIVVVAFVADAKEPAEDLKSFIENGAFDQLDCEVSGGPNKKGHYIVFCEFNRNNVLFREIAEATLSFEVIKT